MRKIRQTPRLKAGGSFTLVFTDTLPPGAGEIENTIFGDFMKPFCSLAFTVTMTGISMKALEALIFPPETTDRGVISMRPEGVVVTLTPLETP